MYTVFIFRKGVLGSDPENNMEADACILEFPGNARAGSVSGLESRYIHRVSLTS
jgi:hypothetical protein